MLPQHRGNQRGKSIQFRRCLPTDQPLVDFPFAEGFVVHSGIDDPPLSAVGQQRQLDFESPHPMQNFGDQIAAAANSQPGVIPVNEYRQNGGIIPEIKPIRLCDVSGSPIGTAPFRLYRRCAAPMAVFVGKITDFL